MKLRLALLIMFGLIAVSLVARGATIEIQTEPRPLFRTICIDTYKYLVIERDEGVAVTQMFKHGITNGRPPQPVRCSHLRKDK